MAEPIEDGDKYTDQCGNEFILDEMSHVNINELTITVFHERSDEELENVQDHFTVEVQDVDDITVKRGLDGKQMAKYLCEKLQEYNF